MTATASVRQKSDATPADVQAFTARLQEFAEIIKRSPAAAQPIGFAGELWGALLGTALPPAPGLPSGRVPQSGSVSFAAFPLTESIRNGKVVNEDLEGGEMETLDFSINFIENVAVWSRPFEWDGDMQGGFESRTGTAVGPLMRLDDRFVNAVRVWLNR